jgi:TfoX/Sxy family transcriptional regulator of competence genes
VTPDDRYAALAATLGIQPSQSRGFGSSCLQVDGRIFAMLVRGTLLVKLPKQRVDALVAAGKGERFDPRRDGRLMKEWLVLGPSAEDDWLSLATEARRFVGGAG